VCIFIALLICTKLMEDSYVRTFVHVLLFFPVCVSIYMHFMSMFIACLFAIVGYSEFLWGNQMTKVGHGRSKYIHPCSMWNATNSATICAPPCIIMCLCMNIMYGS
jgi:hypothetical protein